MQRLKTPPCALALEQLDASLVGAFPSGSRRRPNGRGDGGPSPEPTPDGPRVASGAIAPKGSPESKRHILNDTRRYAEIMYLRDRAFGVGAPLLQN